jgi:hypothetical protein
VGGETWLFSTSGTDVCTAFVGGVPTLPVYQGELQARALGAKVEAIDGDRLRPSIRAGAAARPVREPADRAQLAGPVACSIALCGVRR